MANSSKTVLSPLAGLVAGLVLGVGGTLAWTTMSSDHAGMGDMTQMTMEMPNTGDADSDFMVGMIPHHQLAVVMAQDVLRDGTDPEVRALAEAVIESQSAEITQMQDWVERREAAPAN